MSFMQPDIRESRYIEVDSTEGTFVYPSPEWSAREAATCHDIDTVGHSDAELCAGDHPQIDVKVGFLARLSASGYLDATDWAAFETEAEAIDYLLDMYGTEDDSQPEEWERELEARLAEIEAGETDDE